MLNKFGDNFFMIVCTHPISVLSQLQTMRRHSQHHPAFVPLTQTGPVTDSTHTHNRVSMLLTELLHSEQLVQTVELTINKNYYCIDVAIVMCSEVHVVARFVAQ